MKQNLKSFLTIPFSFIFFCFAIAAYAQTKYTIKGIVADTSSNIKLSNAVVSVLNAKDSILVGFKRTDSNGLFSVDLNQQGTFLMMVSYPGYIVYAEQFTLNDDKKQIDFGKLPLNLKSRFLKEIIVKGEAIAIKIKGDTTEYNAGSYVIESNCARL